MQPENNPIPIYSERQSAAHVIVRWWYVILWCVRSGKISHKRPEGRFSSCIRFIRCLCNDILGHSKGDQAGHYDNPDGSAVSADFYGMCCLMQTEIACSADTN